MEKSKGLWVAFGACGFLVFAGAVFIGIVVFAVVRHLDVRPVTEASAEQEYSRLRDRFEGRPPLIEIDKDNPSNIRVHRAAEVQTLRELTALHVFGWNPRDGKVVRLDMPMWLLRLNPRFGSAHWRWSGEGLDWDNINVTVEDLERHGPGLVFDFEGRRGERLLVWTE
jgi:hypothetical protein